MVSGINTKQLPVSLRLFDRMNLKSPGPANYEVMRLKGGLKSNNQICQTAVQELFERVLPDYYERAGITDPTQKGFRMVVDIEKSREDVVSDRHLDITLMTQPYASPWSPQDWLAPAPRNWTPGEAPFYDACSNAAANGENLADVRTRLLYLQGQTNVFGIFDNDPKAETHFLVLSRQKFGNIMDKDFTSAHLLRFFNTALKLSAMLKISGQQMRFVIDTGTGFQHGKRVHMHVVSDKMGLPGMFPASYGFLVDMGGNITGESFDDYQYSLDHLDVFRMIRKRKEFGGFTGLKKMTNESLFELLDKIKHDR